MYYTLLTYIILYILYVNIGNIYKELYDTNEAVKCYQSAIRIRSDIPDVYISLAAVYSDKKEVCSTYIECILYAYTV